MILWSNEKFLNAINLLVHPSIKIFTPSMADITSALYQMGYQKKIKGIGEFKKNQLPVVWQFVCHFIIRSLSGRTRGTENMGLKLLELVWSIFTGHDVNYGRILWDNFLQYIPKESPRQNPTDLTFARFWSFCISNLHADAGIDMGGDINFFFTKDLKRYNPSSDQTIFGPICKLPTHILSTVGHETADVSDHIEATEGIGPYLPTPPLPSTVINPEGTIVPSSTTLSNVSHSQRRKHKVSTLHGPRNTKKSGTPKKDASKPSKPSKKRKTPPVITTVEPSHHDSNSDSKKDNQPISILKKRKTDSSSQMHDRTDTSASLQAPVVLGKPAHQFETTIFFLSDSESESDSQKRGDSPHPTPPPPVHSQRDNTGGSSSTHARAEPRPNLTTGQGDQGSSGNPSLLSLETSGLRTVSTNMQGSVNPRDTLVRLQGIDGDNSSDSWRKYQPSNEAEAKEYAAFRRAFQARKDQQIVQVCSLIVIRHQK
ncbi:hypothetical protein Lser_V15G02342 [Lactuca serriola]